MFKLKWSAIFVGCLSLVLECQSMRRESLNSDSEIIRESKATLLNLYASNQETEQLAKHAKGILVFPNILKAGFMFGGQYGTDGVLFKDGKADSVYNILAGSYGLQAGVQAFSYVLFFMDDNSVSYLENSDGWEIGLGPSVVIIDQGRARSVSTSTVNSGIYAFIFGQKGLMAGMGLQGSKISRIDPK